METEIWKDIPGYNGNYQASVYGEIRSMNYRRQGIVKILTPGLDRYGYYTYGLRNNGFSKTITGHKLIAITFYEKGPYNQINHKNGIKTDNSIGNLEWCTASDNIKHAFYSGLKKVTENHHFYINHPSKGKFGKDNKLSKPVNQYDLGLNFVKEWNSMMDIKRGLRISPSSVSACCRLKHKTAGGFIWRYK